jgi:hypothetical protein
MKLKLIAFSILVLMNASTLIAQKNISSDLVEYENLKHHLLLKKD